MKRDLDRLEEAGVDLIIVSVEPGDTEDPRGMESFLRFVDLSRPYRLQVAFMLEGHDATVEQVEQFGHWCGLVLPGVDGYFRLDGKPLLVIYDALMATAYSHPGLTVRHTVWEKAWYWGPRWNDRPPKSRNGEQAMAFAGLLKDGDHPGLGWRTEREGGERLRRQFRGAVESGAQFICVASYNDFWEGHFVEPNTLDGDRVYLALKEELERLRGAGEKGSQP